MNSMDRTALAVLATNIFFRQRIAQKCVKQKKQPWEVMKIDLPKSVRKGKSYEQILEIKKQIWESLNKETQHE
jgi:hypothetical protein